MYCVKRADIVPHRSKAPVSYRIVSYRIVDDFVISAIIVSYRIVSYNIAMKPSIYTPRNPEIKGNRKHY